MWTFYVSGRTWGGGGSDSCGHWLCVIMVMVNLQTGGGAGMKCRKASTSGFPGNENERTVERKRDREGKAKFAILPVF